MTEALVEFLGYLAGFIAIIFVFSPHEFAHAYVAYKCGDPTAKMNGRMTLNPLKHFDLFGFLLCAFAGFGWAKPVPIDPYNFRHYRRGLFLTAIAGVVTNFIIAFLGYLLLVVVYKYGVPKTDFLMILFGFLFTLFYDLFSYNLGVAVFNLLPFSPLDGFRVIESATRQFNPVRRFLRKYGRFILMGLVIESFICNMITRYTGLTFIQYFNVLGYVQWFAINIVGYPIRLIWNTIFGYGIPKLMPYGIINSNLLIGKN